MIKKIIVSLGLLFSLVSLAQEGTSSPYSFYGIGDIKFKGTVENRSMGGISVFPDSIHVNLQNPAQFASLKFTSLTIGGTYSNTKFKTESQQEKARRTSLDYLAVGIPAGKLGIGFGLMPYSSVGFKIQKFADATSPVTRRYTGVGGINKAFVGFGYKLSKAFSVGADVQYNFGNIETKSLRFVDGVQFGTRELNTSDISGFNFTTALNYKTKFTDKLSFFGSFVFTPESNLKLANKRSIAIVQFSSQGGEGVVPSPVNVDVDDTTIKLPTKYAFGAGFGEVRKWLVGGEVTLQKNSEMGNRFNDIDNVTFENSTRYSLGGYFIPNYNSYSSYFKKVTYRGGLRYENTGLVINTKSIEDFAVTLGLGLPLAGTFSNINVGLEIGKRGTQYYGLVEENYINLSIGLSLSDRWFIKRKYD